MEYHRDDRYISEIEVLLVLDKGPADAQFHEGHSQGPYPTATYFDYAHAQTVCTRPSPRVEGLVTRLVDRDARHAIRTRSGSRTNSHVRLWLRMPRYDHCQAPPLKRIAWLRVAR